MNAQRIYLLTLLTFLGVLSATATFWAPVECSTRHECKGLFHIGIEAKDSPSGVGTVMLRQITVYPEIGQNPNITIPDTVQYYNSATERYEKYIVISVGQWNGGDKLCKTSIHRLKLPNTVKSIGSYVMQGVWITELLLPDNVTLYQTSLSNMPVLETIYTGKGKISLEYFGSPVATPFFWGCNKLKRVVYAASSVEVSGSTNWGVGLFQGLETLKEVFIPDNVTEIPPFTFAGCVNLERVYQSNFYEEYHYYGQLEDTQLKSIRECAFSGCRSLKYIGVPKTLQIIGTEAFANCDNAAYIIYRSGNDESNRACFNSGQRIFSGDTNIDYIDFSGCDTPPRTASQTGTWKRVFDGLNVDSIALLVSKGTENRYKEADRWKDFGSIYVTPSQGSIETDTFTINKGDTLQLSVKFYEDVAPEFRMPLQWDSSWKRMASVDNSGAVVGNTYGYSNINAYGVISDKFNTGVSYNKVNVVPKVPVTRAILNADTIEFVYGDNTPVALYPIVSPQNATEKVSLQGYNLRGDDFVNISQVSDTVFLSLDYGWWDTNATASLEFTYIEGNWVGSNRTAPQFLDACKLRLIGLFLNSYKKELFTGDKFQLKAETAYNTKVNWESDDEEVATVDENGKVTAKKEGTARITATTATGTKLTKTCEITVSIPVSQIAINPSSTKLAVGETLGLEVQITPTDATNKSVYWWSTNSSVVSVNAEGMLTANKPGKATIFASTEDGTRLSATCAVVVEEGAGITNILIDPDDHVKIYNIHGVLVYEGEYQKSHLIPGTYIIISQGNRIKRIIL